MKIKYFSLTILAVVLFQMAFTASDAGCYSLMLPDIQPDTTLPYVAEQDHYSGPACVQMSLNSCPAVAARHYNSQDDIYNSIVLHNSEPTLWFSSPAGVRGALSDPALLPCGHWSDYSNTDKLTALGKMLYYMDTQKYLMPVAVGDGNIEHWVDVIGFQTDVKPPFSGAITLQNIFFYDPLPGNPSSVWVSGTTWLSSSSYWGVPMNKPGSAWHNKYIAIIEPPKAKIKVRALKWVMEGKILPVEKIERYFSDWLRKAREERLARKSFEVLKGDIRIEKPILVKAETYSYYLIPFKDSRLAAIFNAYDGSFEELRYFKHQQKYTIDMEAINSTLRKKLRAYKSEIVKTATPELRYKPALAPIGRFSPVWEIQAEVRDERGKTLTLPISLNIGGEVISGLERLRIK